VIFTTGTTDAINLVAHGYGRKFVGAGDEIVLTTLEHHSNIVPWQMVAEEKGARIRVVPVNDRGELIFEEYLKLLGPRTRLVGVGHVSNALGTINPVREMIAAAHEKGIPVLVDGAQAAPHMQLDMRARLRFLCVLGAQDVRADRYRRALREGGVAGEDAALQGRRRHDPLGHVREDGLQRDPGQVRSRNAAHRGCDRARRGRGLY
jgi:hypothetical protein